MPHAQHYFSSIALSFWGRLWRFIIANILCLTSSYLIHYTRLLRYIKGSVGGNDTFNIKIVSSKLKLLISQHNSMVLVEHLYISNSIRILYLSLLTCIILVGSEIPQTQGLHNHWKEQTFRYRKIILPNRTSSFAFPLIPFIKLVDTWKIKHPEYYLEHTSISPLLNRITHWLFCHSKRSTTVGKCQ